MRTFVWQKQKICHCFVSDFPLKQLSIDCSRWFPQGYSPSSCPPPSYCYFWLMHLTYRIVSSFTYNIFEDQKAFKDFIISYHIIYQPYLWLYVQKTILLHFSSNCFLSTKTHRSWYKRSDWFPLIDTTCNLTGNGLVTSELFTWNLIAFQENTGNVLRSCSLFI